MKKTAILLSVLLVSACNTGTVNTTDIKPSTKTVNQVSVSAIKGKVQFPAFRTKADLQEVAKDTSVSVLFPPDHAVNANKIIASGLTNSQGEFSINPDSNFTPNVNEIFVLEARKRTGDAGNSIMTVRTHLKWTGSSWESMTTPGIFVNSHTTALAIVSGYNQAILPSSDTINTINVVNSATVPTTVNGISDTVINTVKDLVDGVLTNGKDPFAVIKFENNAYSVVNDQVAPVTNLKNIIQKNSCSGCDLRGVNLTDISLAGKDLSYADLRGLNLANQDLSETILIGADLRGATLPDDLSYMDFSEAKFTQNDLRLSTDSTKIKNLKGTNFSYADMTEINLSGTDANNMADLSKARWTGVSFSNGKMRFANAQKAHFFDCKFDSTDVRDSDFSGADLTAVDLSTVKDDMGTKTLSNLYLKDAILTGANLSGHDLRQLKSNPLNSIDKLGNAQLTGINLELSILQGIDLSNKNFFQANLKGATFTGTGFTDNKLLKANFRNANLTGAKLNNIDLSDLNFSNCDLSDAVLTGSRAIGTDFTGANLQGAYLNTGVNFIRTKFVSADMRGLKAFRSATDTDFSYADMSGFNLASMGMASVSFTKSATGTGCIFNKTNLTGANTSGSGTSYANSIMKGVKLVGGSFTSNNFTNVQFGTGQDSADLSDSNFNSANFNGSGTISYTTRSLSTNFIVATWWNGVICQGSASYNGVCANSSGQVQP